MVALFVTTASHPDRHGFTGPVTPVGVGSAWSSLVAGCPIRSTTRRRFMEDHDQRFKVLLQEFLRLFVALMLPDWLERFDFDNPEWLQQEQFSAPPQGPRAFLDLLVSLPIRPNPGEPRPHEPRQGV